MTSTYKEKAERAIIVVGLLAMAGLATYHAATAEPEEPNHHKIIQVQTSVLGTVCFVMLDNDNRPSHFSCVHTGGDYATRSWSESPGRLFDPTGDYAEW